MTHKRRRRRIRARAALRERMRRATAPKGWLTSDTVARFIADEALLDFNAQYYLAPLPMTRSEIERAVAEMADYAPMPGADYEEQYWRNARMPVTR